MLHFLLDNVFIQVGGKVFQQCVGIPMGTNCAPLLAELLLHDYESSAMIRFSRTNGHPQAKSFEFTRRYIDDLISVNNPRFDKAIEKIYPSELTLKDTTLADGKVAYLDRQIEIRDRQLVMSLYDKRDDFPFAIHNYPHLDSNVPCMPTYGVYISQLIRFAKACDTYPDFLTRHQRLVATLMRQPGRVSSMICFAGNSNSSIVLTLILSVVTPNLSLNTYARASIVRFSEPVVIVAARAPSSWSSGCLHWPWLSASLVPLSLFLGRSLFYMDFFFFFFFFYERSAWTRIFIFFRFFFPRREKSGRTRAC